jgi:CRP-like cAMP-binding protein
MGSPWKKLDRHQYGAWGGGVHPGKLSGNQDGPMPQHYDPATLGLAPDSEVARLLAQFPEIEPRSYGDGEQLIREDEASLEIFLILKGAVVVEQAGAAGAPAQLMAWVEADLERLAVVGEMAYLGAQARAGSVRSSGRSHSLRLEPHHVDAILEGYPGLTRLICQQFSRRLRATDEALRELQARFALQPAQRMAAAGELLFAAGTEATELFQLVLGSVLLEGPDGCRTVTAADLPQGFLEPQAFLAGGFHRCTATVADMAFLAVIGAGRREAVVRGFPEMVLGMLGSDGLPPIFNSLANR